MVDPTVFEQDCFAKVLSPLGEYVAELGIYKTFDALSREEVLTLIEVVVTAYMDAFNVGLSPKDGGQHVRF